MKIEGIGTVPMPWNSPALGEGAGAGNGNIRGRYFAKCWPRSQPKVRERPMLMPGTVTSL